MLISHVNGIEVNKHPIATFLLGAGFAASPRGFNVQRKLAPLHGVAAAGASADEGENL
jgi:hypothetical protein